MIIRRIVGILLILTGLLGVVLGVGTGVVGLRVVGELETTLNDAISMAADGLGLTREVLVQVEGAVGEADQALEAALQTVSDVGVTVEDASPMLDQVSAIISDDVPDSLDSMEQGIPQVAEVAKTLDQTLRTLSSVRWQSDLLGIDFNLGIEYDSEVPLDEPIVAFGDSLSGLSQRFRELEPELDSTGRSLEQIGEGMQEASGALSAVRDDIVGFGPAARQYVVQIDRINENLAQSQDSLHAKFRLARLGVILLAVWLFLFQLAPFYLGWELLTGQAPFLRSPVSFPDAEEESDPD